MRRIVMHLMLAYYVPTASWASEHAEPWSMDVLNWCCNWRMKNEINQRVLELEVWSFQIFWQNIFLHFPISAYYTKPRKRNSTFCSVKRENKMTNVNGVLIKTCYKLRYIIYSRHATPYELIWLCFIVKLVLDYNCCRHLNRFHFH